MGKKTRVVFLHRKGLSGSGSKIMRCDQLKDICARYLDDDFEFSVLAQRPIRTGAVLDKTCRAVQDCIVILLKGTPAQFGDEGMQQLSENARAVGVDYVDANVRSSFSKHADFHIGASHVGCRMLKEHMAVSGAEAGKGQVVHLTHHADPRLAGMRGAQEGGLAVGYLGHPDNVHLPGVIKDQVRVLSYEKDSVIADAFEALNQLNMHYCVRSQRKSGTENTGVAKPFTKGFTAATLGANVMTLRDTDDAEHYLGEDYPFFVDTPDEADINAALDRARDLFGTSVWIEALDRMAHVRAQVSPERVAQEMDNILSEYA